jgi:hypothetical protein
VSYSTTPSGTDGHYTPEERAQFAAIRQQLRDDGLPRRETRDIAMAVQVAQTFRRARALIGTERQIAYGIQPLPSGGD